MGNGWGLVLSAVVFAATGCAATHGQSRLPDVKSQSAALTHRWDPTKTRVFAVGLAEFKGDPPGEPSFSQYDRTDSAFVDLMRERGVPASKVVFLKDKQATALRVTKAFEDLLDASERDELLIFYFGSHGSYDAEDGTFEFSTYESVLPFRWVFDAIESKFRGSQAMLFADTCYSGGLVEMAKKQSGRVGYGALSSTASHNVAWSEWRFGEALVRGFSGNPTVDVNGSGNIDFDELAGFTARHMAFVAEGKPMVATTKGFDKKLVLSDLRAKKKGPEIGKYYEVEQDGEWYPAEVIDVDGKMRKVHYTRVDSLYEEEWVSKDRLRAHARAKFAIGQEVECKDVDDDKWYSGRVIAKFESMHLCRFDGWSSAYDSWTGPSHIRASE